MSIVMKFTTTISEGIKSVINAKSLGATKRERILNNYGDEAVMRDWQNVGKDISTSMKKYEVISRYGR